MKNAWILGMLLLAGAGPLLAQQSPAPSSLEPYRPQIHFSPKAHWINDPNGMVFYKGTYHLFYQYYPDSTVWGPMHWGHATSKDMIHWQEQPVALYPDSLGYIFSGSAVVDVNNTSGFGKNGQVPLVAVFTHHNPKLEKSDPTHVQQQSVAYSLDEGKTWTKYAGNPVVPNPGITDFRDPKVRWYEPQKKWIMTLATKDRVTFYSSPNLKNWTRESEFGSDAGAHGGVWECPDLFPLTHNGKTTWVLLVSIGSNAPNGGTATQYFVGDFDGKTFTPASTQTKWMDYGTDNYAGVTFANTGSRTILIGWMNNWLYANKVPTTAWRGATTVPRELALTQVGNELYMTSNPIRELDRLDKQAVSLKNLTVKGETDLTDKLKAGTGPFRLELATPNTADFAIVLANQQGNELVIGYDKTANSYFIDRTKSGKVDFDKTFPGRHTAPRLSTIPTMQLTLLVDRASVELFADGGLTAMTDVFFPDTPLNQLRIKSVKSVTVSNLIYTPLTPSIPANL
jgi:fructan beta-fructosidase